MDDMQNENGLVLTQEDADIIGEVSNISMGSAATALSNIMGKKVIITSPKVEVGTLETIDKIQRIPSIGVIISYTEGVIGKDILVIKKSDAMHIVGAMMGEEPSEDEEFGEIEISAIAEVMNQMMGSSATALSSFLGKAVNISPPSAFEMTEENYKEKLKYVYDQVNNVILVRFLFKVEDILESDLYMIMSREFSQELVEAMMKNLGMSEPDEAPAASEEIPVTQPEPQVSPEPMPLNIAPEPQYNVPPAQPQPQPQYNVPPAAMQPQPQYNVPPAAMQPQPQYNVPPAAVQPQPQYYAPPAAAQPQQQYYTQAAAAAVPLVQTQVRPVRLTNFNAEPNLSAAEKSNFDLIQSVPLELSVEVGKARKLVKEIIDLSVGSIVELDKQAGDPVDIIVNGQLIAHGEVVVIDESFGVRVTEILDTKNNGKQ